MRRSFPAEKSNCKTATVKIARFESERTRGELQLRGLRDWPGSEHGGVESGKREMNFARTYPNRD